MDAVEQRRASSTSATPTRRRQRHLRVELQHEDRQVRGTERAGEQRVRQQPQEAHRRKCILRWMPVDIDAAVIANRRLSADYNVLSLAAPEIAAAARPGQFVMIKTSARARSRCCGVRSRSSKSSATAPARRSASRFSTSASASAPTLLSRVEAGARLSTARPARPSVRAGRSAGGRRGWSPAASDSRRSSRSPPRSPRAARATTLFYGARRGRRALLRRSLRGARRHASCSRPRTAAAASADAITVPLEAALARAAARQSREALRLRPDADDARLRAARRRARPRLRRLARAGDGLRPRRLLQLRGARPRRRTAARRITPARASTARSSTRSAIVWDAVAGH